MSYGTTSQLHAREMKDERCANLEKERSGVGKVNVGRVDSVLEHSNRTETISSDDDEVRSTLVRQHAVRSEVDREIRIVESVLNGEREEEKSVAVAAWVSHCYGDVTRGTD